MSELSGTAKLYESTKRLNLAHEFDIMRWFSSVVEHWLNTDMKIDPTRVRFYMYQEMEELWGLLPTSEPFLVPPRDKNGRDYYKWVVKWASHFLRNDTVNRDHLLLVVNDIRERVSLPPLTV